MWKCKLNKPFPPQLLLGHDVCAGIETLTKTISKYLIPGRITVLGNFFFFLVNLTQNRVTCEEGPQLRNCLHQIGLWECMRDIFLIAYWSMRTQPTVGGVSVPGLSKKSNWASPWTAFVCGLCFQFLPPVPALASPEDGLSTYKPQNTLPFSKFVLVSVLSQQKKSH
jgi:hypothetical protein